MLPDLNNNEVVLPSNLTLNSIGKQKVILIKFPSNAATLLQNPRKLNRLITGSAFNLNIKDIRLNTNRNLIAIEYEFITEGQMQQLLCTKALGEIVVETFLPNSDRYSYGVIDRIPLDYQEDELLEDLQRCNSKIVKIERLKRKDHSTMAWTEARTVKIMFDMKHCPESVNIDFLRYRVRPFIAQPMQCYNCQRLGHTTKSCKATAPRCMICSAAHDKKDCTSQIRKCANCGDSHPANSNQCKYIKKAQEIEQLKAQKGIDYESQTARKIAQEQDYSQSSFKDPEQHIEPTVAKNSSTSYSAAVKQNNPPQKKEVGTQTKSNDPAFKLMQIPKKQPEFYAKLLNFMLDMIQITKSNEGDQARRLLLTSAMRNNFGIDLTIPNTVETPTMEDDVRQGTEKTSKGGSKRKKKERVISENSETEDTSVNSEGSENETIWHTVEKKQVKKPQTKSTIKQKHNKKSRQK